MLFIVVLLIVSYFTIKDEIDIIKMKRKQKAELKQLSKTNVNKRTTIQYQAKTNYKKIEEKERELQRIREAGRLRAEEIRIAKEKEEAERKQRNIERKNSYFTNTSEDETYTQITIETWEKKKEAIDELIGIGESEQINFFDNTNKLTITEEQITTKMLEIRCRKAIENNKGCFKKETAQLIEEMLEIRNQFMELTKQAASYKTSTSLASNLLNRDLYRALRMIENDNDMIEAYFLLNKRIIEHRERLNKKLNRY